MNKKVAVRNLAFPFLLLPIGFGVISFSIAIFSEIAENVANRQIEDFDNAIMVFFKYASSPALHEVMRMITEMGSVWFVAAVTLLLVLYLWIKDRDQWRILFLFIAIGGGGLLIGVLKRYYQIDRPSINEQIDAIGYGFPSGHAMGSLILYGFIIYLIIRSRLSIPKKWVSSAVLIALILLVATSRVYLNAHFPSDVIAGQASGLAWLLVCIISAEVSSSVFGLR